MDEASPGVSASRNDVRDGPRWANDADTWLRVEAAAAFDELHANPSEAVAGDQMRADLAKRHAEHAKDRRRT